MSEPVELGQPGPGALIDHVCALLAEVADVFGRRVTAEHNGTATYADPGEHRETVHARWRAARLQQTTARVEARAACGHALPLGPLGERTCDRQPGHEGVHTGGDMVWSGLS